MSDNPWPPPLPWPSGPLTDGVVLLDRIVAADEPRVVAGAGDVQSQRWLALPHPYGEPEARSFIESRAAAANAGQELTLAIRGADDGVMAGAIGLSQRGYRGTADLGYWMAPDRRGRGWTARAARLLAHHALTALGHKRVEILAAVDNGHSRRVAETAGAVFEGVRRCGMPHPYDGDAAVYSLVRGDVEDVRQ